MAKNNVKQLNYTFDEINLALQAALGTKGIALRYSDDNSAIQLICDGEDVEKRVLSSIQNPVSENGGITLQYQEDGKLQVYYQNGSSNPDDWTPVGDPVVIISADPNANSYRFNFESLTDLYSIQIKSKIDSSINYNDWAIKYTIQEVDKNGIIQPTNIAVDWTISKNSNSRTFSETLLFNPDSSEYSFDWLKRIISDVSFYQTGLYTIKGHFVGTDGNTTNRSWQVNITDLKLSVVLDETTQYSENNLPKANLTIEGNLKKSIKATLIDYSNPLPDQEGGYKQTVIYQKEFAASSDEILDNFTIDHLKHGVYGILFETTGVINDVDINASNVYKEFIFIEVDNQTPLIRWGFDESKELIQYEYETFTYGIYNPIDTTSQLGIELYSENNDKTQILSVVPDNRNYSWVYYAAEGSNNIKQLFSISLTDNKTITNVKRILTKELANASLIQPVGGCTFDFNPVGRSNNDIDRTEYIYNGQNYLQVSENFDWINGGWKYDSQNRPYFCVKAGHWAELDYKLFGSDVRSTGKNFKILFKTTNCQKIDAQAIECYNDNVGLKVLAQNTTLNYRGRESSLIDVPYIEEEIIPLEFNIQKDLQYSKPLKSSIDTEIIRPLVTVFLDADPSQTSPFAASEESLKYNWQQDTAKPIHIGSSDCDVLIYRLKVYEQELTNKQILQNYYADSFTGTEALLKHEENNILNTDGTINIATLKEKYPDLRILEVECDNIWPRGKSSSDYQACTITHSMGNNNLKDNWRVRGRVRLQGTSSLEYISSAGNFDINFRDDILYKHTDGLYYTRQELIDNQFYTAQRLNEMYIHQDTYAMTDNSIPVDYFNIKVNVASSENANNSQLADWFNMHNPYIRSAKQNGVRDTMEFHPCIVFIKEKSTDPKEFPLSENFNFYACGDFGNSKRNDAVFGMNAEDPYECIVEISNNDNPICLFKTAIFENYQTNAEKDAETQLLTPVTNNVWDGDAVEFRYINEGHEDLMKEKVLRLWKWVYSTDTSQPGVKEYFASVENNWSVNTETEQTIFTIDTPIPYDENTIIQTIAPSFLLAREVFNEEESKFEWQTYSKYDLYKYRDEVGIDQVAINITQSSLGSLFTITVPNFSVQFSDLEHSKLGFFINFYNQYVLDDSFTYVLNQNSEKILDNVDYRKNKFQSEYTNYFEKNSLLFHYLFTERFTMIDNRAKNTFIHTNSVDGVYETENGETSEPGSVWNYSFNYDDDTALGCNNKGFLTMDYGVEDIDNIDGYPVQTHGGTPAFNAASSVLWNNVRSLKTELIDAYNANISAWSAESLNQKFETYQSYKCSQLQMLDMERKYFRPYVSGYYGDNSTVITTYLPMLQGRKKYQRKRFQSYQSIYIESKYKQPNVAPTSNIFTFRTTIQGGSIQPEVKPYMKCYPSIKYDQVSAYTDRVWPGESFKPAAYSNPNDKNFTIYPASYISVLNGLNNAGLETATLSSGTKLLEVNLSNNPSLPESANDSIQISEGNTLLQIVDISKTKAQSFENLNKLANLRKFNAQDTDITTAIFATGGLIEEARLGEKISTLAFNSNTSLKVLDIQSLNNLETLRIITPSSQINWPETFNPQMCPKLKNITITDIDYTANSCWVFENSNWLESVYQLKQTYPNVTLTGSIYVERIRKSDYDKYFTAWPGLEIEYTDTITEYKITFKSYDNQELKTFFVIHGESSLEDPKNELAEQLNRPSDNYYTYTFVGWDPVDFDDNGNYIGGNVYEDRVYIATYTVTDREYSITWNISRSSWEPASGRVEKTYQYSLNGLRYMDDVELQRDGKACIINRLVNDEHPSYDISFINVDDENDILSLSQVIAPGRRSRTTYELFSHWDYQTSSLTDDMIISGVWEQSAQLPSDEDYDASTWNAATWHALMETTKEDFNVLEDQYKVLGRRAFIDFTPKTLENAVPIKLIEEPKYFKAADETSFRPMDENNERYKLSKDQDWTVYVEWQYSSSSGIVFSAKPEGGGNGLTISATSNVTWGSSSRTTPSDSTTNPLLGNANTSSSIYAAVISHKKNEDKVHVSFNNMVGSKPVHYVLIATQSMPSNLLIRLGATVDNSGTMSFFGGRIYNCYIYNQYFGESYRSALLEFPHMQIPFDATATGIYSYNSVFTYSDCCGINFTCSCALPWSMRMASSNHDSSLRQHTHDSALMQWLQNRLYNAFPAAWRMLLQIPYVRYTYNTSGYNNSPIWLPSSNEIGATNSSYSSEFKSSNIYTTAFSRLKAQGAWILSPTVLLTTVEYEQLGFSTANSNSSTTRPDGSPFITGDVKNPSDADYDNWTGVYWHGLWNGELRMWVRSYNSNDIYFGYKYNHSYTSNTTTYSSHYGVVPCFAIGRGKKPLNE